MGLDIESTEEEEMLRDMSLTRYVRCETCGHHYQFSIERCPRCQSNQSAPVPANDRKFFAIDLPAGIDSLSDSPDSQPSA